jgi:hypothetical protein
MAINGVGSVLSRVRNIPSRNPVGVTSARENRNYRRIVWNAWVSEWGCIGKLEIDIVNVDVFVAGLGFGLVPLP